MSTEMTVLAMLPPPLDLQMPLHHVVGQLLDFAARRDATGIEDGEALGDVPHEIEPLLDEQHRAIPLDEDALDDRLDLLDHRGLEALGRLVEEQELGLLDQGAGDRELLLLAAGQNASLPPGDRFERWKIIEYKLRHLCVRHPFAEQCQLDVLGDRDVGNDLPGLRHVADPETRALVGLHRSDVAPVELDRPALRRIDARYAPEERRLARAVAAEHRDELAIA